MLSEFNPQNDSDLVTVTVSEIIKSIEECIKRLQFLSNVFAKVFRLSTP